MSWERKQPKRETTLARLTRQAKAIGRLINNHDRAITLEAARLQRAIVTLSKRRDSTNKEMAELRDLQGKIEGLNVQLD